MSKRIVFHPSELLVETVDRLIAAWDPDLEVANIVKPDLLNEAIRDGLTSDVISQLEDVISSMPDDQDCVMLCTCSTIGGKAEEIGKRYGKKVVRIDRPMAEKAVEIGGRIAVVAALMSTMEPTTNLLKQVAEEKGVSADLTLLHVADAWQYKLAGDDDGYIEAIRRFLERIAADFDVIVLAQGSMARAADRLSFDAPPVLTSTTLGVERFLATGGRCEE